MHRVLIRSQLDMMTYNKSIQPQHVRLKPCDIPTTFNVQFKSLRVLLCTLHPCGTPILFKMEMHVPTPKTVNVKKQSNASARCLAEAPTPPPGVSYPPDFHHKRCRRCGIWTCSPAQYNQAESPEHAWGPVVAWGRGSILNPQGSHCLLCKKAGQGSFKFQCFTVSLSSPVILCLCSAYVLSNPHP